MLIAIMVILILIQLVALLFMIWHFGVAMLGIIQNRQPPGPSEPKNSFAIFVCAHNEENAIPALLESLEALDYPKALSVLRYILLSVRKRSQEPCGRVGDDA